MMKLIGMMLVRNEEWVLPASLPTALKWVDEVVALLHRCTDRSEGIFQEYQTKFPGRVYWQTTHREEWDESTDRNLLLEEGRKRGGTHFAMIDADEILARPAMNKIRPTALLMMPGQLLRLPWIHCWRSLTHYRCDNSTFGNARVPLLFCDDLNVHYSEGEGGYTFHRRYPEGLISHDIWDRDRGEGVLHLQHANWTRVVAKQKRYAEDEIRRWGMVRANYAAATDETGLGLTPVPKEWWPVDTRLIDMNAVAWQARP